jgi:hypothetical protein
VRGVVVAGPVLPDPALVVPLLAIGAKPLKADRAGLLVELALGEGATRGRDRLELVPGPLDHGRVEPKPAHHPLGAALEPQALAVAVLRDVVLAEAGVALSGPFLEPGDIVADELAAVLVIADEALEAVDVLVQPDRVEVVAAEIPERLHGRAEDAQELEDLLNVKLTSALPETSEEARAELVEIEDLLERIAALGALDTKRDSLVARTKQLTGDGRAVLIFTGYSDTMAYLRDALVGAFGSTALGRSCPYSPWSTSTSSTAWMNGCTRHLRRAAGFSKPL